MIIFVDPLKNLKQESISRQIEAIKAQHEAIAAANAQARTSETATESEPLFNQTTIIGAAVAVVIAYMITRKKSR